MEDTERDSAAKLRCSKTVVHNSFVKFNADGMFHDRNWSGHPRKTTPREDRSMRRIVMRSPKSSCKTIRSVLRLNVTGMSSNTVLRCLSKEHEMKFRKASTKATPETSDEEQETGLCETPSPLVSR